MSEKGKAENPQLIAVKTVDGEIKSDPELVKTLCDNMPAWQRQEELKGGIEVLGNAVRIISQYFGGRGAMEEAIEGLASELGERRANICVEIVDALQENEEQE